VHKGLKVVVLFEGRDAAGKGGVIKRVSERVNPRVFRTVPEFERMLVRSGIVLIKYWFSITDEDQNLRFLTRIHDPLKRWKLSPMDFESRRRWEEYTKAKEEMQQRTHIPEARWWVVEGVNKKAARLNCIHHPLRQIPYEEVPRPAIVLPVREHKPDYFRTPVPPEMYVPAIY
jgi:polyphosphate kinase 2 (PPK2 family)